MTGPRLAGVGVACYPMGMPKRPRDANKLGKLIVDLATGATPAPTRPQAGSRQAKAPSSQRRAGSPRAPVKARRGR